MLLQFLTETILLRIAAASPASPWESRLGYDHRALRLAFPFSFAASAGVFFGYYREQDQAT
ncbi:hypothetical protein [Bradyrhizobium sp. JR3.5]